MFTCGTRKAETIGLTFISPYAGKSKDIPLRSVLVGIMLKSACTNSMHSVGL